MPCDRVGSPAYRYFGDVSDLSGDESALLDRTDTWDVIVIGGGPPGEIAAQYATQGSDRSALIIEHELVGGECSYWACMPSKALLRPVEVREAARHMPGMASVVDDRALDVPAVLERRNGFTSHHDDSSQVRWATDNAIDVIHAHGRLAGTRTVQITPAGGSPCDIHARHAVVLACGTRATVPDLPGLRAALPWTSRDVTNLREVPRRVAIIGGGVVACEAAWWLRGLGVEELTVISATPELLPRTEPFAGELVRRAFEQAGITVLVQARAGSVARSDPEDTGVGRIHGGVVQVDAGSRTLTVDEVVVAVGRTPATAGLGLDQVGLDNVGPGAGGNRGYVPTDDRLTVRGVPGNWLYAVGDVTGRALLTHMGKYQARIGGAVIAARAEGRQPDGSGYRDIAGDRCVPQVIFTDPQVAAVGLTERAARDAGYDVETVEHDMAAFAGSSLLRDDYVGRAKLVIDRGSDTLLGATFVGSEVAELVHAATVAVVGGVTLDRLWHVVPSYPTLSEIWLKLLESRSCS